MSRSVTAALAVAILFLVFLAYEIAGASTWFTDLHTISYFAYRNLPIKVVVVVGPPIGYVIWILWHLSHFVPK